MRPAERLRAVLDAAMVWTPLDVMCAVVTIPSVEIPPSGYRTKSGAGEVCFVPGLAGIELDNLIRSDFELAYRRHLASSIGKRR